MDEQNWKAQMDAVHDVLDTKAPVARAIKGLSSHMPGPRMRDRLMFKGNLRYFKMVLWIFKVF